jgi:hypothetical protein
MAVITITSENVNYCVFFHLNIWNLTFKNVKKFLLKTSVKNDIIQLH